MRTIAALAFAVVAAQGSPAKADHYLSSADPTVVAGFQQLLQVYGNACQLGNPQSCSVYQLLDGEAIQTLSAGYDCQQGDQQACDYYNYSVGELNPEMVVVALAETRSVQRINSVCSRSRIGVNNVSIGAANKARSNSKTTTVS